MIEPITLRFNLLGQTTILINNEPLPASAWGKRKPRLLWLLLLTAHDHRLRRSTIYETLWPTLELEAAANNLYLALHGLRAALAALPAPAPVVQLASDYLRLELPPGTTLDWREWTAQAQDALAHPHDPARTEHALAAYRGPLDPDPALSEWLWSLQEQIAGLHERLVLQHADWRARTDLAAAQAMLETLHAAQPTQETVVQRLLLVYAHTGRRDAARRLFAHFSAQLQRELDLAPAPETSEIMQAIKQAQTRSLPLQRWGLSAYAPATPTPLPFNAPDVALVGREAERRQIQVAAQLVLRGAGQVVALMGAPGVGKTHLMLHLATELGAQGWHVLLGRAALHEQPTPYGPLIEALARYLQHEPELHFDLHASQALHQVLGAALPVRYRQPSDFPQPNSELLLHLGLLSVSTAISTQAPLVLIIDDAQWADQSTQAWLRFLLRRIDPLRILLVLSYHPATLDHDPTWRSAWQLAERQQSATRIALPGLDGPAARCMLAKLPGPLPPEISAQVVAHAAGNPLFLRELARAWAQQPSAKSWNLPAAVIDAVTVRLAALSPAARAVAEIGALAEVLFTPQLVAAVQNLDLETAQAAVQALIDHAIVRRGPGPHLIFEHQLIRDVLVDLVPLSERRRLLARLAEAAIHHLDDPAPELVLSLLVGAEPQPRLQQAMISYGLRAGQTALALCALPNAARAFEHALAALTQIDGSAAEWAAAWLGLARAAYEQGHYPQATTAYQSATPWTVADPLAEAQRCVGLGWIAYKHSDHPAALAWFQRGGAHIPPTSSVAIEAQVGQALIAHLRGQPAEAQHMLLPVVAHTAAAGPSSLRAKALNMLAATYMEQGVPATAEAYFQLALTASQACGDLPLHALILLNLANLGIRTGNIAAALAHLELAQQHHLHLGHTYQQAITHSLLGWGLYYAGDLRAAAIHLEQALALLQPDLHAQDHVYALNTLTQVQRAQGAWSAARHAAEQALALARSGGFALAESAALRDLARIGLVQGTPPLVVLEDYARQALNLAQAQHRTAWEAPSWIDLGLVLVHQQRWPEARAALQQALDQALSSHMRTIEIEARLAIVELLLHSGSIEQATHELTTAENLAITCGAGLFQAEARHLWTRLHNPATPAVPPCRPSQRLPPGYEAAVLAAFDVDPLRSLRTLARLVADARGEPPRSHHTIRAILKRYGRTTSR